MSSGSGTGLRILGGVIVSVNFFSELENEMNFCLKQVPGKKPCPRPPAGLALPPKETVPEQKDPEGPSRAARLCSIYEAVHSFLFWHGASSLSRENQVGESGSPHVVSHRTET